VALPLVLPPTVLGFYALIARDADSRKLWIALFGHGLAFTFAGLVFAVVRFPFAVQPLMLRLRGSTESFCMHAAVLGREFADVLACKSCRSRCREW